MYLCNLSTPLCIRFKSAVISLQNIAEKIKRESYDQTTGRQDEHKYSLLQYRYQYVFNILHLQGYDIKRHADLSELLVNNFGLLKIPSNKFLQTYFTPSNSSQIWAFVVQVCPSAILRDVHILYNSLLQFSKDDGKPMIMW